MTDRPETARGRPARVSPAAYPFRFPRSRRRARGGFPRQEACRRLLRQYHAHRALMRTLAGRVIQVAEWELELELGHHIHDHAQVMAALRQRLIELRVPRGALDAVPRFAGALEAHLLAAPDTPAFLAGTHAFAARALARAQRAYVEQTNGLADLPSVRVLERAAAGAEDMAAWADQVLEAFVAGGVDAAPIAAWQERLHARLSLGPWLAGADRDAPAPRPDAPWFRRATACARDDRMSTFHHTRRYRADDDADGANDDAPEGAGGEGARFEDRLLEMVRVQRDELDALETFANVLYDLADAPFSLQMLLARLIWDEARHAELGQQMLEQLGHEPFSVPCGVIGINVRAPLPPVLAFAQISMFGELQIVQALRSLAEDAGRRGRSDVQVIFDFIHADEVLHLREGRRWLRNVAPGGDLDALAERARLAAIRRLHEEGVLGEDYGSRIPPDEVDRMLGQMLGE